MDLDLIIVIAQSTLELADNQLINKRHFKYNKRKLHQHTEMISIQYRNDRRFNEQTKAHHELDK